MKVYLVGGAERDKLLDVKDEIKSGSITARGF